MAEQDSSPVAALTASSPTLEDLLLQRTLDRRLPELQRASNSEAAQNWLRPSLRSERGTEQLLDQLERHVQQDSFLAQLQAADAKPSAPPLPGGSGVAVNKDWWTVTEADSSDAQVYGVPFSNDEVVGCNVRGCSSAVIARHSPHPATTSLSGQRTGSGELCGGPGETTKCSTYAVFPIIRPLRASAAPMRMPHRSRSRRCSPMR